MTTRTSFSRALVAAGVGATLVLGAGVAMAQNVEDDSGTDVVEVLQTHLEHERMARDLYDALGETHDGLAPFPRIEAAEQRHHDAVTRLITLKDGTPSADVEPGAYADAEIQAWYDDWLERGLVSPQAAHEVGVELEKADIEHLRSTIDAVDDADVDRVLGHLLEASEHHLAAFEAAADGELPDMADQRQGQGQGGQRGPGTGQHAQRGPQSGAPGAHRDGAANGPGAHQGQGNGRHLGDGTGDCPTVTTDDE